MTASWDQVTALFAAARQLEPDLRAAFLDLACGPDHELRQQVETLLGADHTGDGFLDPPHWPDVLGPPPVVLEAGALLKDRYRVVESIGGGGQALVYRADDELLRRQVVIKVMRTEGRGSLLLKARFEREMHALAVIDHPGVVGILDVGELDDGSPFLVIQYVAGKSLREALRQGKQPKERIADLIVQIAGALQAAHNAGIAHGDLKPENVMVQEVDGGHLNVKLIDFGISKIGTDDREPGTTMLILAGTVRYMAPEQLEGRQLPASDTYALALITCEMLGGHPDMRVLPRSTPRATRHALEAALAYRPEERPASVGAWSAELARGLRARDWKKHPLVAALALAAAVSLGVVATPYLTREALGDTERIVEKVGAFDPLEEGFSTANDVTGRIVGNASNTGYDAWRLVTASQGQYYRQLSTAQKDQALERGWRLAGRFRVDAGAGSISIDLGPSSGRFDVVVLHDGEEEIVRLATQILPDLRGLEIRQSPIGQYHDYELVYDPNLKSANLWVDGERRITGYTGFRQFQLDRGLMLHGHAYGTAEGSVTYKSARFEINP